MVARGLRDQVRTYGLVQPRCGGAVTAGREGSRLVQESSPYCLAGDYGWMFYAQGVWNVHTGFAFRVLGVHNAWTSHVVEAYGTLLNR